MTRWVESYRAFCRRGTLDIVLVEEVAVGVWGFVIWEGWR